MRQRIWILISDASRARIFEHDGTRIVEVGGFARARRAMSFRQLASGQARRGSRGHDGEPGMGRPRKAEVERFARQLAAMLKESLDAHHFDCLEVMAPGYFLGLLRESMDDQVSRRMVTRSEDESMDLALGELLNRNFRGVRRIPAGIKDRYAAARKQWPINSGL